LGCWQDLRARLAGLQTFEILKRRVFWVVARTCLALYGWFPVFGSLRASLAIIHRNGQFLIIQRNDGRGVSLPGGIARRKEAEKETLRREVLEETGLRIIGQELRLRFHSTADVPCDVAVFETQVEGDLKNSWEGSPKWMTAAEIRPRILESQRPVLELMNRMVGTSEDKNAAEG
jgi:ADP-ribose pyrophosphatase YjhB (NUDIX family)